MKIKITYLECGGFGSIIDCNVPRIFCPFCKEQVDPPGVFTVSTSHLEEQQPDGTYKPCGKREATGVLKEYIEQMKTPEESLGVTSEEWNDIVREAIFDDDKKLEEQQ